MKKTKILVIGNSYSVDAIMHDLKDICKKNKKEVILGVLYIGGCCISLHYSNAINNYSNYSYFKYEGDEWEETCNVTLLQGLVDEKWDYISFQQWSGGSGDISTLSNLRKLIDYVTEHKTNTKSKYCWFQTWSYSKDSKHDDFPRYNNDQEYMDRKILELTEYIKNEYKDISIIIPCGENIRKAREYGGDIFNKDGSHLNEFGYIVSAFTWYNTLIK